MNDDIKIFYDKDIDLSFIKDKTVAVIGFGSQGYGQACNLRDSGVEVVLGLRQNGASDKKAKALGFKTMPISDAVKASDIVQILIPDEIQAEVYEKEIAPNLKAGQYLMFSHGLNIHFKKIVAPDNVNVLMVAPKGPGHLVRSEFEAGRGVPALIAIYNDMSENSREVALAYSSAIGAGRVGVLETTFREETETDLFGEQAVLCGGCSALIKAGFETLVEAGYAPQMAYFEVLHELKLITDLIHQGGIDDMHYSISNTAEYGDLTRGPRIITSSVKEEMKKVLKEIQSGQFVNEFFDDIKSGGKKFDELRKKSAGHQVELVGKKLRSMFNWDLKSKLIDRNKN